MTSGAIKALPGAMLCVTEGLPEGARVGRGALVLLRFVTDTAGSDLPARSGFAARRVARVALPVRRRAGRYRQPRAAIKRAVVT